MPLAIESPWPREPVTASIPGVIMSGWPCSLPREGLQLPHLFPRNRAQFHQRRVLDENGMPLADEKTIPVWILQRFGIEVHLPEVQGRHDLGERARTTQVSRLADTDHPHDVSPEVPRDPFDSSESLQDLPSIFLPAQDFRSPPRLYFNLRIVRSTCSSMRDSARGPSWALIASRIFR
jgi:hypothetical protein